MKFLKLAKSFTYLLYLYSLLKYLELIICNKLIFHQTFYDLSFNYLNILVIFLLKNSLGLNLVFYSDKIIEQLLYIRNLNQCIIIK